ncbi:MAG: ABC transporter ATP-binding protein, partial [Clostridia bacterium]|nr:ABC transporter ATP-binding protein [Clostridia bacterium]
MEIIKLNNIHKKYNEGKQNEVHALCGVDLVINKGESIAIMGVSGSGKSTLLNIIGCLDSMTSGDYFLDGTNIKCKNMTELAEIRNSIFGFILQSYGLIDSDRVLSNVRIPLLFSKKYKSKQHNDRIDYVLNKLKISHLKNTKVRELSGGQKQRVAIARALINDPDIILADEPTSALDSGTADEIIAILKELQTKGVTIIVVTHDINVAKKMDRIVTIK